MLWERRKKRESRDRNEQWALAGGNRHRDSYQCVVTSTWTLWISNTWIQALWVGNTRIQDLWVGKTRIQAVWVSNKGFSQIKCRHQPVARWAFFVVLWFTLPQNIFAHRLVEMGQGQSVIEGTVAPGTFLIWEEPLALAFVLRLWKRQGEIWGELQDRPRDKVDEFSSRYLWIPVLSCASMLERRKWWIFGVQSRTKIFLETPSPMFSAQQRWKGFISET